VTFVHCSQTVGRIKTKLGTQVGLGPGHSVLDGDPAPPPPTGHSFPIFGTTYMDDVRLSHLNKDYLLTYLHICGQMAAWIKMSLCMELGLGPGDFMLDGDPARFSTKGERSPLPSNFRPMFIVAHVYCGMKLVLGMEVGLSPSDFVLDGVQGPPQKEAGSPSSFRPISVVAKWLDASNCHLVWT